MSGQYDNEKKGVLFKNTEKREGKRDADYRGSCTINGQEFWLNAWLNTSRNGQTKYMSLTFEPKQAREHQGAAKNPPAQYPQRAGQPAQVQPDFDDEIPF